jgi:hypothetical protein
MRDAKYIVYGSLDELRESYPDAVKHITIVFPNYHGKVYKFLDLDEFGIYEMTEGYLRSIIDFDTPDVRPINLEEAIDFHTLGRNILDAGLINVTYYKGCAYVLPDLK